MEKSQTLLIQWKEALPVFGNSDLKDDLKAFNQWILFGENSLKNKEVEQISTFDFQHTLAYGRGRFIRLHGEEIYAQLTSNFQTRIRVEDLVYAIADEFRGLAPTKEEIELDSFVTLPQKKGYEISQGIILGELIALPKVGKHLMATMRFPNVKSLTVLSEFEKSGVLELETVRLEKKDGIGYLTISNGAYLNAEDDQLNEDMEVAVDLVLLDGEIQLGVMRGDLMTHEKYYNKRVFCSGINLTKLYNGELPYLYYVTRELALMSKIFRGILTPLFDWEQRIDSGLEKPWIVAVDTHAIGGGAQLALVADIVVADKLSYFTIPARTEGFIPGFANFRLQRYTGQRLARKMIYFNHKVFSDSEEGRLLVDEIVETEEMENVVNSIAKDIILKGVQGMISNRKAFRVGVESLEQFRNYMAMFCQEQARCMYTIEIIKNLESFWMNRKKNKEIQIDQ
jgi:(3,5-dihydroxyphenyl)acetyl-CoA 1,2-dioxygenase